MMKQLSPEQARRVEALQERINAALHETPEDWENSDFSEYMPDASTQHAEKRLMQAALPGGLAGVEAALDEFDRLSANDDALRLQHALMIFLTHHPAAAELGLRIPSLQERSSWKVLPSKRSY